MTTPPSSTQMKPHTHPVVASARTSRQLKTRSRLNFVPETSVVKRIRIVAVR